MTQETTWLDYTEPPPSNYRCGFCYAGDATSDERAGCIVVHWHASKAEHDPPGMQVFVWPKEKASDPPTAWCAALRGKVHFAAFDGDGGETKARIAAWAWYDRRRAIVLDIDEQTGAGLDLSVMLSAALAWTDAECAEVEAYAALPFPRPIDMPQTLQRVLLPQGET